MLRLQVDAPLYRILELAVSLLQDLDRLSVCDPLEVVVDYVVQPVEEALVDELVEELHLLRSVLKYVVDDVFDHLLAPVHVALEVAESELRLDHPELRSVPCRVGVLGAERRSECVCVPECQGEDLSLELSAYCKRSLLAEEVLFVIYVSVFHRHIVEVQSRYLEHLACAFGVARRDDRRVRVNEVVLLEELVDRVSSQRTDSEYSRERIAARSEVRDLSEILHAVTFFLERIVRIGAGFYLDALCLDLERLLCVRCKDECSVDPESSRDRRFADLLVVFQDLRLIYDLNGFEERTVVELDEAELVGSSVRPDPASDSDVLSCKFLCSAEQISYCYVFHDHSFSCFL